MNHEENEVELKIEKVEIIEDEMPHKAEDGRTWQEEFEMAGSELADFLKKASREVTARRIVVTNKHGRTLLDIPIAVGAIGLIPPLLIWTAGLTALALLASCKVRIEHAAPPEIEGNGPAEEAPAA